MRTIVTAGLVLLIIILTGCLLYMRSRAARTLESIEEMLDAAIDGTFSERMFDETRLSKIEAKMYRYLSAGRTSREKLTGEQASIKALVSDISHQTKTPVSNILLYSELMGEDDALDKNSKRLLANIREQAEKLNFLIQALVRTSRLENGILTVEPEENSVRELLGEMNFADVAGEKGVTYELSDMPELKAVFDRKWTAEAVSNIIDNAVKYTPAGGRVTVSAAEYEMFVRIDIADTGIGISEEDTAKLFRRFYRSPRVHDERGVGLGLYLAREIVSRENGYIKAEPGPDGGSVFSVFLPRKQILTEP